MTSPDLFLGALVILAGKQASGETSPRQALDAALKLATGWEPPEAQEEVVEVEPVPVEEEQETPVQGQKGIGPNRAGRTGFWRGRQAAGPDGNAGTFVANSRPKPEVQLVKKEPRTENQSNLSGGGLGRPAFPDRNYQSPIPEPKKGMGPNLSDVDTTPLSIIKGDKTELPTTQGSFAEDDHRMKQPGLSAERPISRRETRSTESNEVKPLGMVRRVVRRVLGTTNDKPIPDEPKRPSPQETKPEQKALSALNETSGGALVTPAHQRFIPRSPRVAASRLLGMKGIGPNQRDDHRVGNISEPIDDWSSTPESKRGRGRRAEDDAVRARVMDDFNNELRNRQTDSDEVREEVRQNEGTKVLGPNRTDEVESEIGSAYPSIDKGDKPRMWPSANYPTLAERPYRQTPRNPISARRDGRPDPQSITPGGPRVPRVRSRPVGVVAPDYDNSDVLQQEGITKPHPPSPPEAKPVPRKQTTHNPSEH